MCASYYVCMVVLSFPMLKLSRIVSGTCRSDEKVAGLQSRGFQAFHFNPDNDGENLKSVLIFLFFCPLFCLSFYHSFSKNNSPIIWILCICSVHPWLSSPDMWKQGYKLGDILWSSERSWYTMCSLYLIFVNIHSCGRENAVQELYAATHVLSSIPPVGDFDEDPVC